MGKTKTTTAAYLGFEDKLWAAAEQADAGGRRLHGPPLIGKALGRITQHLYRRQRA